MSMIGVILAGGKSRRMGQDKALLSIEQSTQLARTKHVLTQTSVSKVLVSRNDGHEAHIADLVAQKGPLSGIHSLAMRYPNHDLLIVPVDLPLIDSETLQLLIDTSQSTNRNVRFSKHSLPLVLKNTEVLRQSLDYTLRVTDSFSVGQFCSNFPLIELQPESDSSLYNANTPEQWRFAMQFIPLPISVQSSEACYEPFK